MRKILFVADNNELDLRILKLILVRNPVFGRELFFKDGHTLVDYIRANYNDAVNLPDVIFMDIDMSGSNSESALESLKNIYHRLAKPIAVYIVSASVNAARIQKALNYDFVKEFIPKPIYRNKIVEIAKKTDNYHAYMN